MQYVARQRDEVRVASSESDRRSKESRIPTVRSLTGIIALSVLGLSVLGSGLAPAQAPILNGSVTDAEGQPIPDAKILVFEEPVPEDADLTDRLRFVVELTEEGSFAPIAEARTGPSGLYTVVAKTEPSGSHGYRVVVVGPDGAVRAQRRHRAARLDVVFGSGTTRFGRVTNAAGQPLRLEGELYLAADESSSTGQGTIEVIVRKLAPSLSRISTDADGVFRLSHGTDLEPVAVVFSAPGMQSQYIDAATLGDAASSPTPFTMLPGHELSGRVVTESGEPAVGAHVGISSDALKGPPGQWRAQCDEEGDFAFDTLGPGEYVVTAFMPGFTPATAHATAGGQPVRLTVEVGETITGRAVDSKTGSPVANAEIRAQIGRGFRQTTVSAEDGSFELRGIPFSKRSRRSARAPLTGIEVRAPGHTTEMIRVQRGHGPIEVRLERIARLAGMVRSPADEPLGGVEVVAMMLRESGAELTRRTRSKPDGEFEFDEIPANAEIRLVFTTADLPSFVHAVDALEPGSTTTGIDVRFPQPLTISGKVLDAEGRPIADAAVGVLGEIMEYRDATKLDRWSTTRQDGSFTITGLGSGTHRLLASKTGYTSQHVEIRGSSGETVTAKIELKVSGTVRGRVIDANGNPVANAEIEVFDTSDGFRRVQGRTDEQGQVVLTGLGTEPVRVTIEHEGYRQLRLEVVPTTSGTVLIWTLEKR